MGTSKPDLLWQAPTGLRLYTNLGSGAFRDDTASAQEVGYSAIMAAAWIDYDGARSARHRVRHLFPGPALYRNLGRSQPDKSQAALV
jgi:hypothetical protein